MAEAKTLAGVQFTGTNAARQQTLVLIARSTDDPIQVDVGAEGDSPGDFFQTSVVLFDETGANEVGAAMSRCELAVDGLTCVATASIDAGKLQVSGSAFDGGAMTFAVTGGTDTYHKVGGEMTPYDLVSGDTVLVFSLVRVPSTTTG